MSSTIWTQCGGPSRLASLSEVAWRVVEDQSQVATRKLVDSDAEQVRLEWLIESKKPPLPRGPEWEHLHYLLATPFRYPPLAHGSRFGTRLERGVWYGSVQVGTALSEVAYWRLRFFSDTEAALTSTVTLTAYSITVRSPRAIDLTNPPFVAFRPQISSPITYQHSQSLGHELRRAGVEFCRYYSARDPHGGENIAVFSPLAFAKKTVADSSMEIWYAYASAAGVEFRRRAFTQEKRIGFRRSDFEIDGALPLMKA